MTTSDDFKKNPGQYKTFEQSSQGLNAAELAKKLDQLKAQKATISDDQKLQKQLAVKELGATGSLFEKVERELKNTASEISHTISLLDADLKTYRSGVLTYIIGTMSNSLSPLNQQKENEQQRLANIKDKLEMVEYLKTNPDPNKGPSLVQAREYYNNDDFDQCIGTTKQLRLLLRPYLKTEGEQP